jgi:hypothetical protein
MTTHVEPQHNTPQLNWPALLDTTLFGAIGVMLLAKTSRGVLTYYIHPRYTALVVACGIILLAIGALRSRAIWRGGICCSRCRCCWASWCRPSPSTARYWRCAGLI